jgi:hypothetical protein
MPNDRSRHLAASCLAEEGTFPRGSRCGSARTFSTAEGSMNKLFAVLPVANSVVPNEDGENGPTLTRLAADPHLNPPRSRSC